MTNHESTIWRAIGIAAERHKIHPEVIIDLDDRHVDVVGARQTAYREAHNMGVMVKDIAAFFGASARTVSHYISRDRVLVGVGNNQGVVIPSPPPPDLPRNRSDWSEIDWMRAMAHEENQAMRAR